MSRVLNQAVPPSLIDAYQSLVNTRGKRAGAGNLATLKTGVRAGEGKAEAKIDTKTANHAAQWLTEKWIPSADKATRATFRAARKNEILNGVYPSTYWWTPAPTQDTAEYCTPNFQTILTPENSSMSPAYYDPARQPMRCFYSNVTRSYATPTPPGTQQDPAPGWSGQVTNGIWRDAWMVQRLRKYTLPVTIEKFSERPVLLDLNATIQATASFRGHRNWFSIGVTVHDWSPPTRSGAVATYGTHEQYQYAIPPANNNGWTATIQRRLVRNADDFWRHKFFSRNRLSVRTSTSPARGYYFARNDLVTVYHQIALTVAVAKSP